MICNPAVEYHDAYEAGRAESQAEIDRLRAELAEANEKVDRVVRANFEARLRAREAEARLDNVIALCDRNIGDGYRYKLDPIKVRAAATGETK